MFTDAFLWSLAAGACTVVGVVMLFIKRDWGDSGLAFFMGLASGVMGAVVLFDLLPSALVAGGWRVTAVGSGCGIVLLALFNHMVLKRDDKDSSLATLGYLIMLGIAVHDLPEGMAIALGQEMKARTGMVIAMGIGIHNIPEGMAIAAPLLMAGISRIRILLQAVMVGLITPLGTVLGKAAACYSPGCLPFLLSLASGVMVYLVLCQLWPEARRYSSPWRYVGLWLGAALIAAATYI